MARGTIQCPNGQTTTLIEGGTAYPKIRKMSNALIRNTSGGTVYLQWTEEDDALTAANGWDLAGGETIALTFEREQQRYAPDILVFNSSGSTVTLKYVIE